MKAQHFIILFFFAVFFMSCANRQKNPEKPLLEIIDHTLEFSAKQSILMAESLKDMPGKLPKTTNAAGELETCNSDWWVSGFFPGLLWYLFEFSGDEQVKSWANFYMKRVENEQYTTDNHDVGFIIFCSYGNAYRITSDSTFLPIIENAAKSLSTRFNPLIGSIRSWDEHSWSKQWQYPVIIDNMMNLELLTWSSKAFSEPDFFKLAVNHANNSMLHHYRGDFSSYHVVSYDTITNEIEKKNTAQGYSHESAWARGQSWGLYGFVMMFRETGDSLYLNHARSIASYLINHPNMPDDMIPYWDYNFPEIPNALRDASAAAIMCSSLIELSAYVPENESKTFLDVAEIQIRNLSKPPYLNELGASGNFILNHSVGHFPNQTEIDVPLSYTDYYFIEALMRMRTLCLK